MDLNYEWTKTQQTTLKDGERDISVLRVNGQVEGAWKKKKMAGGGGGERTGV